MSRQHEKKKKNSRNASQEQGTRCLKITEKVSFNIASEASYVYIFSGQKLTKIANNDPFWRVLENLKIACGQIVLPDKSILIGQKLMENAKMPKFKCDILSNFQTMCVRYHFWLVFVR